MRNESESKNFSFTEEFSLLLFICSNQWHRSVELFIVGNRSEFVTAGDGAEGFCRVGHERFDLLHSARDAGQQLYTVSCHGYVIFNANLHTVMTQQSNTVELERRRCSKRQTQSMQKCKRTWEFMLNLSWISHWKICIHIATLALNII